MSWMLKSLVLVLSCRSNMSEYEANRKIVMQNTAHILVIPRRVVHELRLQ